MSTRVFGFIGGTRGGWAVESVRRVIGEPLERVACVDVVEGPDGALRPDARWTLRGVTSNARYATGDEKARLQARQAELGRSSSDRAALIPIRKSEAWWNLPQDERRAIFEERSHHIAIGLEFLPAIARRLHHCRDLGGSEPFDFLTFFDYSAADEPAFDRMLVRLRASEEWRFVEREVDIRLVRRSPVPKGTGPG